MFLATRHHIKNHTAVRQLSVRIQYYAQCLPQVLQLPPVKTQSVDDYRQALALLWSDIIEHHGGTIVFNLNLTASRDAKGKLISKETRTATAKQETLAMALICGADPTRYGSLLLDLANHYAAGRDLYPKDLLTAYSLLLEYKVPTNARPRQDHRSTDTINSNPQSSSNPRDSDPPGPPAPSAAAPNSTATTAPTTVTPTPSTTMRPPAGHTFAQAVQTPPNTVTIPAPDTSLTQWAATMAQHDHSIDPSWILLDSQSTFSVFRNPNMLSDIRPPHHTIRAVTNGGYQDSTMIGDFHGLGTPCTAWYNAASIANILSLSDIRKICTVTMDSSKSPSLVVHKPDGTLMSFDEHPCGLYVHHHNPTNAPIDHYTLLSTVKANKKPFTQHQIQQADTARKLYRMLGRPDEIFFRDLLNNNLIINCPVTADDALRALHIYGPDVAALKGKMTRSTAAIRAPSFKSVPLPSPILEQHPNITLCADFFFIQDHGFLHTISRNLNYRTIVSVPDRSHSTIKTEFKRVIHMYQQRGFTVSNIHGDHEFDGVRDFFSPIRFNIVAANGHVGEVERSIHTIKKRFSFHGPRPPVPPPSHPPPSVHDL